MISLSLFYCCKKVFTHIKDITIADCTHVKRVSKDFEIKDLGEYRDLYVQNDTLLLADVFENFRNMCLEIYERDPEGQKCESKIRFFN